MGLIIFFRYFKGERDGGFVTILFFLGTTGLVNIFKRVLLGGLDIFGVVTSTAPTTLCLDNFWINNVYIFRRRFGGLLSNSIILLLSAIGIYMLDHEKSYQLYLKILMATSSIYYLVNHVTLMGRPRNPIPSRILFNIPFGVIIALGILYFLRNNQSKKMTKLFILIFITMNLSVYLFRSLVNLVY